MRPWHWSHFNYNTIWHKSKLPCKSLSWNSKGEGENCWLIRWGLGLLLNGNAVFSLCTLPASNNTGYFFIPCSESTCNLIKKQTACKYSAIMNALIVVHTSLSWYYSIHTGFVIINCFGRLNVLYWYVSM